MNVGKWILTIIAILGIANLTPIALRQFLHSFHVPTGAMQPTIRGVQRFPDGSTVGGDFILAEKYVYWFSDPKPGDVVVFENRGFTDGLPQDFYVKRVAGIPGDTLSVRGGRLFNADRPIEAPDVLAKLRIVEPQGSTPAYLRADGPPFQVPDGTYFVVGDNSANSADSRYWGPVPREAIKGRVAKIYWPWNRMGLLDRH